MNPTDFGLSVLASWLANQVGVSKAQKSESSESAESMKEVSDGFGPEKKVRKFKTYDVYRDLEEMLKYINQPVAHIIVEDSPSSFYNLATLVIEDKETGIWFVFCRGRMAFQGGGGGAKQTDIAVSIFKNKNIPIAPWVLCKEVLDRFENGYILWPQIQDSLVPLISSIQNIDNWKWIQKQAHQVLYSVEKV